MFLFLYKSVHENMVDMSEHIIRQRKHCNFAVFLHILTNFAVMLVKHKQLLIFQHPHFLHHTGEGLALLLQQKLQKNLTCELFEVFFPEIWKDVLCINGGF